MSADCCLALTLALRGLGCAERTIQGLRCERLSGTDRS